MKHFKYISITEEEYAELEKGAEARNLNDIHSLAGSLFTEKLYDEAIEIYKIGAEMNDPTCCIQIGLIYWGKKKEYKKALEYIRKARDLKAPDNRIQNMMIHNLKDTILHENQKKLASKSKQFNCKKPPKT